MLAGTLPDTMTKLQLLNYFYAQSNSLTGMIASITIMQLTVLSSGSIPRIQSTNLIYLYLQDNHLTGNKAIYFEWKSINLCLGFETGSLSESLGACPGLQSLFLSHNSLTGTSLSLLE
jgi:hypothetical protein